MIEMLINGVVEAIINRAIKTTTTTAISTQMAMNRNHINGIKAEVVDNIIHSEENNLRNEYVVTQMVKTAIHLLQARS